MRRKELRGGRSAKEEGATRRVRGVKSERMEVA